MSVPFHATDWYALERDLLSTTLRIESAGFPMNRSKAQALLADSRLPMERVAESHGFGARNRATSAVAFSQLATSTRSCADPALVSS